MWKDTASVRLQSLTSELERSVPRRDLQQRNAELTRARERLRIAAMSDKELKLEVASCKEAESKLKDADRDLKRLERERAAEKLRVDELEELHRAHYQPIFDKIRSGDVEPPRWSSVLRHLGRGEDEVSRSAEHPMASRGCRVSWDAKFRHQ